MGVNAAGPREILGFGVGDSASEATWRAVGQDRKARGLHGVDLVGSDQHAGWVRALQREFQGGSWQRCQTHCSRTVLDACPKASTTAFPPPCGRCSTLRTGAGRIG
jgi:transposase-like protein